MKNFENLRIFSRLSDSHALMLSLSIIGRRRFKF